MAAYHPGSAAHSGKASEDEPVAATIAKAASKRALLAYYIPQTLYAEAEFGRKRRCRSLGRPIAS
jgi:hypothetical protein